MVGVVHPGKFIEEILMNRGMTQEQLAELLDKPKSKLSVIISGKASITAEWAVSLGMVFGGEKFYTNEGEEKYYNAETWLQLQSLYDLEKVKKGYDADDINLRITLSEKFPLRELMKRGYLPKETSGKKIQRNILKLFGVDKIDDVFDCYATFKRTEIFDYNENNMKVWLKLAEVKVDFSKLGKYNPQGLTDFIADIASYTIRGEQGIKMVENKLKELGVALILLKHFEKTRVDGATFWHKETNNPVVVLSLRYDRINNFWFTLTHEIAHIVLHEKILKEKAIIEEPVVLSENSQQQNIEKEANDFASDKLINPVLRRHILGGPLTALRITNIARLNGVHPALIVGHLQHEKIIDFFQLSRIANEKVVIPAGMQLP